MKDANSPIHRLPDELLGEILILSVRESWMDIQGPMSPGVCRRWRMVALSTPRIWSYIAFLSPQHSQAEFHLAETCLARSGQYPLTIYIGHHAKKAMELLVPFSARWICFTIRTNPSIAPSLSVIRGKVPLLKSLKLINPGQDPTFAFAAFDPAPRLRHVTYFEHCDIDKPLASWDQLVSCAVTSFRHFNGTIDLLTNAPNITDLTVHLQVQSQELACHSHCLTIKHSRLASLHLHAPFHAGLLLDNLELPALRDLRIYPSFDTTSQFASVTALLSRSACNLTTLLIHMGAASAQELSQLLKPAPSLEHLTLEFDQGYRWLNALRILKPEHGLVPVLRTLCIDFKGDFDFAEFASMVEARSCEGLYGGSYLFLKTVRARCYCDAPFSRVDPLTLERLRSLRREGVDVGFTVGQELGEKGEPFL